MKRSLLKNINIWLLIFLLGSSFTACNIFTPLRTTNSTESVSKEDIFRDDIISLASKYEGSKYKYAGKDPKGFDCSGFTYFVFKQRDIALSPSSRAQEKDGRSIPVKSVKPGDLVFFRRSPVGKVFHVALVVSNDREGLTVIHSTNRGVVVDNISNNSYWEPKISSARDVISGNY